MAEWVTYLYMKANYRAGLTEAGGVRAAAMAMLLVFGLAVAAKAEDEKPAVDPKAQELLRHMSECLGDAKFYSFKAEIWQDVMLGSGERVQAGRTVDVQVRRPNRLHTEVRSTRRNRAMFYDGKSLTILNRAENFYGSVPAPGNLDEALDTASEKFGIEIPLEDFIVSDPYKNAMKDATWGKYLGPVTVLGVPCEHLVFTRGPVDWQVWIQDGPRPVPRKFVITYKDEEGSPQFTAILSDWDFETKLPDFVFQFAPSPGMAKIEVQEIKARNQEHGKEQK